MTLTQEISKALAEIQAENHVVHEGLRTSLMNSVAPVFDSGNPGDFFPLRPSGCLKPMRDLYYDLVNYYEPGSIPKQEFEPRIKLIFQFGHITETLLKKLCSHNFNVEFEQQRVKYGELLDKDGTTIPLTGAIDWAMKLDVSSDKLTLVDAKSIGDFPFKKAPKEENIAQMQLYMHSDWGRANKVDSAILIYFNKNSSEIKCIEVPYDGQLATNLLKRLQLVWDYYKKGEVPPREYLAGIDWQADYSPYIDYDNREFSITPAQREVIRLEEYFTPARYQKDTIRTHAEKYGGAIVRYLDSTVQIVYDNKKLNLSVS